MNDRELLEKAAKAAGIEGYKFLIGTYAKNDAVGIPMCNYGTSNQRSWNPLTDDGDAPRLAVKLGANVYSGYGRTLAELPNDAERDYESASEPHGNNPYAATRRAIVRAAAAIGETMK